MIMNNENQKLSRNRKKRVERKIKMDDNMKPLLSKIKTEKEKKNEIFDEVRNLETELVKINDSNNPNKIQSELKEFKKFQVIDKNLHEIKFKKLLDYTGEFEEVGDLKIGDQVRQTHIIFRNIDDYQAYINSVDKRYDAEDAIFNGYIYKINTLQFNKVNRSQYGNGCDFKHETVEYQGKNCYIPTKC